MIDTVIFDFAGTLFMPRFGAEQVRKAAESLGLELAAEDCLRLAGDCWAAGFPGGPSPTVVPDQLRPIYDHRDLSSEHHRAAYVGLISAIDHPHRDLPGAIYELVLQPENWMLYADAREVIEALKRRDIRIGVLSNVGFDIRPILVGHGLGALAPFCTMSYAVGVVKPDPRIFEAALRALGSEPSRTLMVGDHADADRGGEALGIRTLILPMSSPGGDHGLAQVLELIDPARRGAGS